uniref:C2 NT-type domain-containing protein n=1 Tax=Meloidogyne floridensis TaxID=298350 RepID=A0A915NF26_9BILA
MKQIIKKIERFNKKATKFKFRIEPQQMTIETDDKWYPDQVFLVCQHKNKRFTSQPRKLESSCTIACRRLVVWPESMPDPIEFETTLFNLNSDLFEDKIWTLILEGSMTKLRGEKFKLKQRPLASTELNMKNLISQPGMKAEINIKFCKLEMILITVRSFEEEYFNTPIIPSNNLNNSPQKILLEEKNISLYVDDNNQQKQQQLIQNIDQNDGNIKKTFKNSPLEPSIIITKNFNISSKSLEIFNEKQNINKEINQNENIKQIFENGVEQNGKYIENNHHQLINETNNLFEQKKFKKPIQNLPSSSALPPPPPSPPHPSPLLPSSSSTTTPQQNILYSNNRSSIRPIPPNKAEVQALAARFIASKRPDMVLFKTPTTSSSGKSPKVVLIPPPIDNDSNALIEEGRKISSELKQIKQKIGEIEEQDELVKLKILDYERGSEQENEIIEHHQRLVGEKEQLSRRQDYLNFQLELSEVDFKIINLRKLLATSVGENEENLNNEGIFKYKYIMDGENILINGRRDSNQMLMELKEFMDIKDELTHKLSDLEAEDEEGIERSKLILEQTRNQNLNFRRGTQDPLNVSKRLMGWLNGMEQRFRQ